MKQETHSAVEDAIACTTGVGRECVNGRRFFAGFEEYDAAELSVCLMHSYVVKKAPAVSTNQ
jgi:hypothetical protein